MDDMLQLPDIRVLCETKVSLKCTQEDICLIRHDYPDAFFLYDFTKKTISRHDMLRMPLKYDGTSRYCQTPSGKIFIIGGFKGLGRVLNQIIKNGFNEYYYVQMASLKYRREEHAVCCLDKYLIVSGSFSVELEQAYKRVERYDMQRKKWEDLPKLNQGRALHSTCAFKDRYALVFCGEQMPNGGLTNSIERLDMNNLVAGWRTITIASAKNHLTRPRQVPAVVQLNTTDILIMGGFAISSALKGLF